MKNSKGMVECFIWFLIVYLMFIYGCRNKQPQKEETLSAPIQFKKSNVDDFFKILKNGYTPTLADSDYFLGDHDESEFGFFEKVCTVNHWNDRKCKEFFDTSYNHKPLNQRVSFYLLWFKKRFSLDGSYKIISQKTSEEIYPGKHFDYPYEILEVETSTGKRVKFIRGVDQASASMHGRMNPFEIDGMKISDTLQKELNKPSRLIEVVVKVGMKEMVNKP